MVKIKEAKGIRRFILKLTNKRAIALWPFGVRVINLKTVLWRSNYVINHELIHIKQQAEMLIIPFYLWYLIEWLIRLPINGRGAYRSISFEREAYTNQRRWTYLPKRKHYSWLKYLTVKK